MAPPPTRHLPADLQLEIAAHSDDAATILRCAATCKPLRGGILSPSFLPRRRHALRAAVNAGFPLARLLGVSAASRNRGDGPSRSFRLVASLLRSFETVSSRDGLLVLWRHDAKNDPELRVHNTFNGRVTNLPCMDVEDKWGAGGIYSPALLAVGRVGHTFDLLVMDACLRMRTITSRVGEWGPIRVVKPPPAHDHWGAMEQAMRSSPTVIGRRVHWICRSTRTGELFILALHVDEAVAKSIGLPPGCHGGIGGCCGLFATAERELSVVVAETLVVSTWTLSAKGWCPEVVVSKKVLPDMDAVLNWMVWFVGFGKTNGIMLLWMEGVGLVQLNLGTKQAIVCTERDKSKVARVSLHEIDLAALIWA